MNNGKRGRKEKSFNWKDTKDRDQAYLHDTLTKLVLTLAWYNSRESECTSRGDIESRISFDFLRSRKLFPPPTTRINICNGEKEREREPSHPLAERKTHGCLSLPNLCFLFNNRKSVEMNLSRVKGEGNNVIEPVGNFETYPYSRYRDIKDWKKITLDIYLVYTRWMDNTGCWRNKDELLLWRTAILK